jgi:hypothetical protein
MAQHDYNLANQSGADFRADLNNALSAIVTVNSGATAPSTTFAHQLWVDTSSSVLKIRNSANDAWVTTGVSITADNTFAGNLTGNVTGNLTGDVTGNADTATALETARTINGASFDGTANISFGTDSVSEGSSNLYFTNARVESYLDAGTSTPTFASAVINTSLTGSAILDDDTFGTASVTTVATSESIKAYVDSQVGSVDTLAEILLNGNTTGGTDISLSSSDITGTGNINVTGTVTSDGLTTSGNLDIVSSYPRINLTDTGENPDYSIINANGIFNIYDVQNNSNRLSISPTGIDVTGTAVTDGLTVNSGDTSSFLSIRNGSNSSFTKLYSDLNGVTILDVDANNVGASPRFQIDVSEVQALRITEGGDISFYDSAGTTQGFFWDSSSERLGIGTTAPSRGIHLKESDGWSQIRLEGASGSGGSEILMGDSTTESKGRIQYVNSANYMRFDGNGTERMRLNSTGLGIGTNSPSDKLDVGGALRLTANISYDSNKSGRIYKASNHGLAFHGVTGTANDFAMFNPSGQLMVVNPTGTNDVSLIPTADGSVGIGTTNPQAKLQIDDGYFYFKNDSYSDNNRIGFGNPARDGDAGYIDYIGVGNFTGHLAFGLVTSATNTGATEVARFDNNGRLGIGTTSPGEKLSVSGGIIRVQNGSNTTFYEEDKIHSYAANGYVIDGREGLILETSTADTDIILSPTGNVGIGTTSPDRLLDVVGTDTIIAKFENTTATANGRIYLTAGSQTASIEQYGQSHASLPNVTQFSVPSETRFLCGGSTIATMKSSGNIGIGTTSPSANLHVLSSGNGEIEIERASGALINLQAQSARGVIGTDTNHELQLKTNGSGRMTINTAGNVGIGTTSPSEKLHVVGGAATVKIESSTNEASLKYDNSTTTGAIKLANNDLKTELGGSEVMRILANGNIGIGTASPSTTLELSNGFNAPILRLSNENNSITAGGDLGVIEFYSGDNSNSGDSVQASISVIQPTTDNVSGEFVFKTSNAVENSGALTERLRIAKDGSVGIGTDSPSAALNIVNSGLSNQFRVSNTESDATTKYGAIVGSHYTNAEEPITGMLMTSSSSVTGGTVSIGGGISSTNAVNNILFYTAANNTTLTGSERARIDSSGNFLCGGTFYGQDDSFSVTANGEILVARASGAGRTMASFKNGGTSVGSITTTTTATAYNTTSDARLKDVTGEARGLEVITKLNPVAYNWKADGKADEGLIAQEVKELVPNAVTGSEDEHYQMDYSKLVTHLVKAVQELEQQTIELKEEIANLKGE